MARPFWSFTKFRGTSMTAVSVEHSENGRQSRKTTARFR
ncbi:hypothetical protein I549_6079 [Mycobacterium avium subsp. avium 2285 (R)]|nr:hypothetical protein I549_6079 [Mycobacterium avium subsp. avium 2285 (R)]